MKFISTILIRQICSSSFKNSSYHPPYSYTIYRNMLQPEIVYVNLNGKCFVDETGGLDPCCNALSNQPKAGCYAIADHALAEMLGERLIANPHDGPTDLAITVYL
jgi:hypothetical protein